MIRVGGREGSKVGGGGRRGAVTRAAGGGETKCRLEVGGTTRQKAAVWIMGIGLALDTWGSDYGSAGASAGVWGRCYASRLLLHLSRVNAKA